MCACVRVYGVYMCVCECECKCPLLSRLEQTGGGAYIKIKQGPDLYSSASRGISVAVLPLNHVISRRGHRISSISVAILSLNSEF